MRGIYQWTVSRPNKAALVYVGQGMIIERRRLEHIGALTKKTHHNQHLQRAFDKYGPSAFHFSVLELMEGATPDELLVAERCWWAQRCVELGTKNVANVGEPGVNPVQTVRGRAAQLEGLTRRNIDPKWRAASSAANKRRAGQYELRAPAGTYVLVTNLAEFSRENGLDQPAMCRVASGKKKTHKGWQRWEEN